MKNYLLLFFCFLLFSQDSVGQYKKIFKETFRNNKNGWKLYNDSDFIVQIRHGKLYIQKLGLNRKRNGCLWYNKSIPHFDTKKNFSIFFYAKVLSYGDIFNAIDLQWGNPLNYENRSDKNSTLYQISISPTDIRLALFESNKGWTYFDRLNTPLSDEWAKDDEEADETDISSLLRKGKFNKYEIDHIDKDIFIKINDKIVYKNTITNISGNSIGIQQCLKSAWKIDKLLIKQE
jgi:hypothetical protein